MARPVERVVRRRWGSERLLRPRTAEGWAPTVTANNKDIDAVLDVAIDESIWEDADRKELSTVRSRRSQPGVREHEVGCSQS